MALKVTVKVGNISNLSDARYCAGMGVDLLGFVVVAGKPGYVEPDRFQEMRGWFAGPQVVAEAYGADDFDYIIKNYQPDLVELSVEDLLILNPEGIKLIIAITPEGFSRYGSIVEKHKPEIAYLLVPANTPQPDILELARHFSILVDDAEGSYKQLIDLKNVGLALKGSEEARPGYKQYDELAEVLEFLEEM
ncbi:MAG: hypothetical protein KF845_10970 [Cyclobacteriaceae bacterium]|nr:hypothetical protein [Cyclobacteriaceae bacterium]